MDTRKILKSLGLIACIILLSSMIVKHTSHDETLLDYAAKNPELAYATPQVSPSPTATPDEGSDTDTPSSDSFRSDITDSSSLTGVSLSGETSEISDLEEVSSPHTPSPDESFYYTKLTDEVKERITGISYPITQSEYQSSVTEAEAVNVISDDVQLSVTYDDLRYLKVLYYDFHGEIQEGELICNQSIADDLNEIFYELYLNEYQIESIRLIDDFQGDDTASMEANNTSCFNYRVVEGTSSLSKHALGCAIDINPLYNPYIVFDQTGSGQNDISPQGSEPYADRSKTFPYKIDENDLCYKLFKEHGFIWGGDWNSCKDYQHFQKVS